MKAVILAAGQGTRLGPVEVPHKSLTPIGDRRLIDFSLELVAGAHLQAPVSEIILVVGHNSQYVMNYVGSDYRGIPVKYVHQHERKGIAHAIITAKPFIQDNFILCLSDEILVSPRTDEMMEYFRVNQADCVCGAILDASDHRMKAISLDVDQEMNLIRISEKPEFYYSDFRGIGECIFSRRMLGLLDVLQPNSKRGEYEMGDWIRLGIEANLNCKVFDLAKAYLNINTVDDIQIAQDLCRTQVFSK